MTVPTYDAAIENGQVGFWGSRPLVQKISSITLLFVISLIGLQMYKVRSTNDLRFDSRSVDVAARLRVLNERFQADVLTALIGKPVDWRINVTRFDATIDDLYKGNLNGIINIDTEEKGEIPEAPTEEIRIQLKDQQKQMDDMAATAESLLRSAPGSAQRASLLEDLERENARLSEKTNETTKAYSRNSELKLSDTILRQWALTGVASLLGLVIGLLIAHQITRPLERVVARAREIGNGDLRGTALPMVSTDEVGQLSAAFNGMQSGLRNVTAQTRSASEALAAAAAEILASAQEQAAGTGEQSAAVQQTTTTMEEISRSGSQISDKARQVATSAEATSAASEAGLQAVQEASRTMGTIQQQAETVAENVVALNDKTRAIGNIISTVNDIAEQSHLLALNAAIEAAGAGEQGRRFSVVADEMKHLADQSREATVQVRAILGEIQKQIHTAVLLTEESVKRTDEGRRQSDMAEATIRRMSSSIIDSVNAFQQIVAAAGQQQIGFEQVTQAAQQIRAAVDQATVGTRQLEQAAINVNSLSQELRQAIETYRL